MLAYSGSASRPSDWSIAGDHPDPHDSRKSPFKEPSTLEANQRARAFYERRGFRAIAFGDGSGNEERCPDVLYEWRPPSAQGSSPIGKRCSAAYNRWRI